MAEFMSPDCASATSGPLRGLIVISALWRFFSTVRITFVSNLSCRILRILVRPVSTSLRMAVVISHCLPVYSTFISALRDLGQYMGTIGKTALLLYIYNFSREATSQFESNLLLKLLTLRPY